MTDSEIVCELYRDGMRIKDIADLLHCSNTTISRALHDGKVELRYGGFASYVPTEEEIKQHRHRILKQRGILLETGMLADAH